MSATDEDHAAYLRVGHFPSLDGLRGVAIIPVVWHHCTTRPLDGVLGRGPLGVDLFFAISGFLITTLLLRERDASGRVAIGAFYARRSLRIFPLYYAVLALYTANAALFMPDGPQRAHFLRSLPFYASYTGNWFTDVGVTHPVSFAFSWSLAAEEQFYVVWGVLFGAASLATGRARWMLPTALALGLLAVDYAIVYGLGTSLLPPGGLGRRIAGSIASPICTGALLAMALHTQAGFVLLSPLLARPYSALLALALVVLAACIDGVPLWLAQLLLTLLVGACCARPDHGARWLTDARVLRWVGTVSYGTYLFHVAIITLARRTFPTALAGAGQVFSVALPASVAVASASYVWLERPVARLRARFRRATPTPWSRGGV